MEIAEVALGTRNEELPAEQSSRRSPERRIQLRNNAALSTAACSTIYSGTKKRLQRGLHIHFPSNRVILQGQASQADQSQHFLINPMLLDYRYYPIRHVLPNQSNIT